MDAYYHHVKGNKSLSFLMKSPMELVIDLLKSFPSIRRLLLRSQNCLLLQKGPTPKGLVNLGNTCFLNSVIQAVSSCKPFVDYLDRLNHRKPFTMQLSECVKEIRRPTSSQGGAHNARELMRLLAEYNSDFGGQEQQDAEELLQNILSFLMEENRVQAAPSATTAVFGARLGLSALSLDEASNKSPNRVTAPNPFEGWIASHLECQRCRSKRGCKHQLFMDIPLSLSGGEYAPRGFGRRDDRGPNARGLNNHGSSSSNPTLKGGTRSVYSLSAASPSATSMQQQRPRQQQQQQQPRQGWGTDELTVEGCLEEFVRGEMLSDVECPACTALETKKRLQEHIEKFEQFHNLPVELQNDLKLKKRALKAVSSAITLGKTDSIIFDLERGSCDDLLGEEDVESDAGVSSPVSHCAPAPGGVDVEDVDLTDFDVSQDHTDESGWRISFSPASSGVEPLSPPVTAAFFTDPLNVLGRPQDHCDGGSRSGALRERNFSCSSADSNTTLNTSVRSHSTGQRNHFDEYLIEYVRTAVKKTLFLSRLPKLLCLHLNRRVFCPETGRMMKLQQKVRFGKTLDMQRFYRPNGEERMNVKSQGIRSSQGHKYQLRAVIEHTGSADSGHYVTYSYIEKEPGSKEGQWMLFSDDKVRPVTLERVLACQAYMLFYTLKEPKPSESATGQIDESVNNDSIIENALRSSVALRKNVDRL